MTSLLQPFAQRLNDRYNWLMYARSTNEYYNYSGFYNFGYWTENTRDQREASANLVDRLIEMLPHRAGTILDVACGMGASSQRLLRYYRPSDITGINISEKQLATCHERAPGCRFLNMSATSLRFPDNSFDNVLCVEAVFHFDSRERFLKEAYRVLKPGGGLALSDIVLRSKAFAERSNRIPIANYVSSLQDYKRTYVRCKFDDLRVIEAREPCWEGHRDSLLGYSLGRLQAGQASWDGFRRLAARLRLWDWAIGNYLLVSARKPRGSR